MGNKCRALRRAPIYHQKYHQAFCEDSLNKALLFAQQRSGMLKSVTGCMETAPGGNTKWVPP